MTLMRALSLYLLVGTTALALQQEPMFRPPTTSALTKACASVALCSSIMINTALPVMATDDGASIRVEVNRPYIVELIRNRQEREAYAEKIRFLADGAKYVLEPILKVELPTDTKDFVKDALRGKADVKVNGLDFAVKVVGSEKGSVTVQLSSDLLPRLPVVGLPGTSPVVNAASEAVSEAVSDSTPAVLNFIDRVREVRRQQLQRPPFWTTPINADKVRLDLSLGTKEIHRAITPLDIAGVGSVGVGAAYGASYWYYLELQSAEERASAEKKQKAAEKKKAQADVVVETKTPPTPKATAPKAPKQKTEKKEKTELAVGNGTSEAPLLQTRVRRSFGPKKVGLVRRLFRRS